VKYVKLFAPGKKNADEKLSHSALVFGKRFVHQQKGDIFDILTSKCPLILLQKTSTRLHVTFAPISDLSHYYWHLI
jgi:hypothetical protein